MAPTRAPKPKQPCQLPLPLRPWGGRRRGAGRKPKGPRPLVPHRPRGPLSRHQPVHVTQRFLPHVWNLRSRRALRVVAERIAKANAVGDLRITHFSLQGNHLHLIVEVAGQERLGRGMKGLAVRLARGLNRLMGRRGPVFADHYHSHVLRTLAEVHHALAYVRGNFASHAARAGRPAPAGPDPFSSDGPLGAAVVVPARSWLLRTATGT